MNLKTKLLLASVAILMGVVLTLIYSSRVINDQIENRFISHSLKSKLVLWEKIINTQIDLMESNTSALIRSREIKEALVKADYKTLKESIVGPYNRLSVLGVLTQVEIFNVHGDYIAAYPSEKVGKTKRSLVQGAITEGKIMRGIEVDDQGEITASLAFPVTKRGKLVGIALYVRHLRDALIDFKKNDGADVVLFDQTQTMQMTTDEKLITKFDWEEVLKGKAKLQIAMHEGFGYFLSMQPIVNWKKEPIGFLTTVTEDSHGVFFERKIKIYSYSAVISVILVSLILLYWYTNHSLNPLTYIASALERIADGDISKTIQPRKTCLEIDQLQSVAIKMNEQLRSIISQIDRITNDIYSSANTMVDTCGEAQIGLERQQMDITQVASAIDEMNHTILDVARNATVAAEATHHAEEETQQGRETVIIGNESIETLVDEIARTAQELTQLENETRSMDAVLDVIKGIADQTNLLALNAAIEAARAGDQGRGFAVVADEVRTLAKRTQESTENIRDMLEHYVVMASSTSNSMTQSQVLAKESAKRSSLITDAFDRIAEIIGSVDSMNTQIATAAEQQGAVTEDIAKNMAQIKLVSEMNADGASNVSAASEHQKQLAGELNVLVEHFKLK